MQEREQELIRNYLPMTEPGFLTLLFLQRPRHGYAIIQKVSQATNGRVVLSASTVYTILYKMEQDGLIAFTGEEERRKVYRITPAGHAVLLAETERLDAALRLAVQVTETEGSEKDG